VVVGRRVRREDHEQARVGDRADLPALVLGEVEDVPDARALGLPALLDVDLALDDDEPCRLARLVVLPQVAGGEQRRDPARGALLRQQDLGCLGWRSYALRSQEFMRAATH
jgi:hypothetical protein